MSANRVANGVANGGLLREELSLSTSRQHGEDHPDVAGWAWDPSAASGANADLGDAGDDAR
ncbi:hypothetical protein [Sinomonas humi]